MLIDTHICSSGTAIDIICLRAYAGVSIDTPRL